MSLNIWTQCGAASSIRPLNFKAYRVVEDQYISSTYKLVDSPEEHELLEEILEEAKPRLYPREYGEYHYLLFTPFRYPPLRHGSRFGRVFERGIWYGSLSVETALAETAYYRLVFVEGTEADLLPLDLRFVVYSANVTSPRGVDLTAEPFVRYKGALANPSDYSASQEVGTAMQQEHVEAVIFASARDPEGGDNAAVFTPFAFAHKNLHPNRQQSWAAVVNSQVVYFHKKLGGPRKTHAFYREQFLHDGGLPAPSC